MNLVRDLLKGLGDFISSDATVHYQVKATVFEEEEYEEDPLLDDERKEVYSTDAEANKAFVDSYKMYMWNHYGREPKYRTDLYCAMFPVDILDPSVDSNLTLRYWWFAVTHPVARVLCNHFKSYKAHCSEGVYDSKLYGSCVIYSDEVMEFVVDSMFEMFNANGVVLEDVRSEYALSVGGLYEGEEGQSITSNSNDIVYDMNGELKNKPTENPQMKSIPRPAEGSKKLE